MCKSKLVKIIRALSNLYSSLFFCHWWIWIFLLFLYLTIDSSKSSEDVVKEGQILSEMLKILEQRDSLNELLEEDRQRCGPPLKHGCVQRCLSGPPVLQHFQAALLRRVPSKEGLSLTWLLVILAVIWVLSYVVVGMFCSLSVADYTL
jgi:ABC-type glycerol-3-phosphate transport system permease component